MQLHRKRIKPILYGLWVIVALIVALFLGVISAAAEEGNCANCHGDLARLESLSERASKVFVDPAQYGGEVHGSLDCVVCHAGDPTSDTPETACVGIAYKDPAAPEVVGDTCGSCHPEIAARHLNSIHKSLDGIRLSLQDFLGEAEGQTRFQETCNKCHASCSDCHMEKPGAHGLLSPSTQSHHFEAESISEVCVACHDGTGTTYFGEQGVSEHPGSAMAEAGMECMDCHNEQDVHGTGEKTNFVVESPKPECLDCHGEPAKQANLTSGVRVAPQYDPDRSEHKDHAQGLSCVACHTMWYDSCWNCHQGREERKVDDIFLGVNPLTGLVHPAVHSPATAPDWGPVPPEIGGGWAIKSRHSWGVSQTCEYCHTGGDVYVSGMDRQAPFVGVWGPERLGASFVDEEMVGLLVIDQGALEADVHGGTACAGCHSSASDQVCTDCHTSSTKTGTTMLPAESDWSRLNYLTASANLSQMRDLIDQSRQAGINRPGWEEGWSALRNRYLLAANAFHGNPGQAQLDMGPITQESQDLLAKFQSDLSSEQANRQFLSAGVPLAGGLLGAAVLGFVVYRPSQKKKQGEDES